MAISGKRRLLNARWIKRDLTYTVEELAQLFHIHVNTVRNWKSQGLQPIDGGRPILFSGCEVASFLKKKRTLAKRKCLPDEFYCLKCRVPRHPVDLTIQLENQSEKIDRLVGNCSSCGTRMYRASSVARRNALTQHFILQPA